MCHNHRQNPFQTVTPNALLSVSLPLPRVSNIFPYKNILGGIRGHPGDIPRPSRTCVVFANVPEIRCGSVGICPDLHAQAQVRRHRLHLKGFRSRDDCVVFGHTHFIDAFPTLRQPRHLLDSCQTSTGLLKPTPASPHRIRHVCAHLFHRVLRSVPAHVAAELLASSAPKTSTSSSQMRFLHSHGCGLNGLRFFFRAQATQQQLPMLVSRFALEPSLRVSQSSPPRFKCAAVLFSASKKSAPLDIVPQLGPHLPQPRLCASAREIVTVPDDRHLRLGMEESRGCCSASSGPVQRQF